MQSGNNNKRTSLRNSSGIKIGYDVENRTISEATGTSSKDIKVAEYNHFNLPVYISVDNVPHYPSKYQIESGICYYHSENPPFAGVKKLFDQTWDMDVKTYNANIKPKELKKYDVKGRPRVPDQFAVMGEGAKYHAERCIKKGLISIDNGVSIDWHWCHLIAFSMLPTNKAQVKKNLVCGTSAFNGQMMNVESAVKDFIYNYDRILRVEVTVEIVANTHLASHLRYRVFDFKTRLIHDEIYFPLTITFSNISDKDSIYKKLEKKFVV